MSEAATAGSAGGPGRGDPPALLAPLTLRGVTIPNRIWVSPMCQYSADDAGTPTRWHVVHLGGLALSGAGLVMTEATAVNAEGRISPHDTGIWNQVHVGEWMPIIDFVHAHGAIAGIQLAHAGRKASTAVPADGGGALPPGDAWETLGPSAVAFGDLPAPVAMDQAALDRVRDDFIAGAGRAFEAGFDLIELHAAHGYLLNQFLSPLSNTRTDRYGGDRAGRMRWPLEVVEAVRAEWPDDRPMLVRVSATDWAAPGEGWELEDTVAFASACAERGVDLVDCSSGGILAHPDIPVGPGYQVPFAAEVRARTGVPTVAVGMITGAAQAEDIVARGDADAVMLARELLRNPAWPRQAAAELGGEVTWPVQYGRAKPRP